MQMSRCLILVSSFVFLMPLMAHAEKIVVIGDSHSCGDFGKQLVKDLAKGGQNEVVMYCSPGLSVQHFLKGFTPKNSANNCKTYSSTSSHPTNCFGTGRTPKLDEILRKEHAARVVPALGTNNLGKNAWESFRPFAEKIKATGAKCDWIGPPTLGTNGAICRKYGQNLAPLVEKIKSSVSSSCSFVDSRRETPVTGTPDCIHRFGASAKKWADGVASHVGQDTGAAPRSVGSNPTRRRSVE